ncbi:MAG: sulfotransferase family protein, partial [Chloroflexota bacterium]
MALQVIGAGVGRTGTLSLKLALEQLGYDKCYHMEEVPKNHGHTVQWVRALKGSDADWDAIFEGYAATTNEPGALFYAELAAHYPEAKVILTVRDPAQWYESASATILNLPPPFMMPALRFLSHFTEATKG